MAIILGEEHPYNTDPHNYVIDLRGKVRTVAHPNITPSKRVVLALKSARTDIRTNGFRKGVLDAIFDDALKEEFSDKEYREKFLRRLNRWAKPSKRRILLERCETLAMWRRDGCFVPDAYLIDRDKKTVVCYEIEDRHPLNPFSVAGYGAAWWTLEYIYWDLHLIAYDIYGNPRVVDLPESEFIAREVRRTRKPPPA
jgi:hypothetical protein